MKFNREVSKLLSKLVFWKKQTDQFGQTDYYQAEDVPAVYKISDVSTYYAIIHDFVLNEPYLQHQVKENLNKTEDFFRVYINPDRIKDVRTILYFTYQDILVNGLIKFLDIISEHYDNQWPDKIENITIKSKVICQNNRIMIQSSLIIVPKGGADDE